MNFSKLEALLSERLRNLLYKFLKFIQVITKRLYRAAKQDIEDDGVAWPLDKAFVIREGDDLTFVTWGAMRKETLAAAEKLAEEGIEAEVISAATLSPLDTETILASVEKTGRCVIVHEAARTSGFGAEISARLAEDALLSLQAPIVRVTGPDTIMPLPKSEHLYLPSVEQILEGARRVLETS